MPGNNRGRSRDGDRSDFRFEIVKHFGVLSTAANGWTKEFNLVSWNGRNPKYDIRDWQPDHSKMSKGVTLSLDEVTELFEILESVSEEFGDDEDEESHRSAA